MSPSKQKVLAMRLGPVGPAPSSQPEKEVQIAKGELLLQDEVVGEVSLRIDDPAAFGVLTAGRYLIVLADE